MKIKQRMEDAINEQINAELYSSYLYLSMAAQFESMNLRGFAHWMRLQSQEEHMHAMKFFDYVVERGGEVALSALNEPPAKWKNPTAVFEEVLGHEQKVTALIYKLADLASSEKDHASSVFLQWFINEQVEEEAQASEILETLRMAGESSMGLLRMDHRLGKRGKG